MGTVLVLAACTGEEEGELEPAPAPAATVSGSTSVDSPTDFTAEPDNERLGVVLTWSAPAAAVDSFMILRDGFQRRRVPGSATTFIDEQIDLGRWYVYEIEAELGEETSARAEASTVVERPPIEEARLAGTFSVELQATRLTGFEESGPSESKDVMSLRPNCERGACSVLRWSLRLAGSDGTLRLKEGTYKGSASGPSRTLCGDQAMTSRVTLSLHVTEAELMDHEWRATEIEGTLDEVALEQLGCVGTRATYDVTGFYAPALAEPTEDPAIET